MSWSPPLLAYHLGSTFRNLILRNSLSFRFLLFDNSLFAFLRLGWNLSLLFLQFLGLFMIEFGILLWWALLLFWCSHLSWRLGLSFFLRSGLLILLSFLPRWLATFFWLGCNLSLAFCFVYLIRRSRGSWRIIFHSYLFLGDLLLLWLVLGLWVDLRCLADRLFSIIDVCLFLVFRLRVHLRYLTKLFSFLSLSLILFPWWFLFRFQILFSFCLFFQFHWLFALRFGRFWLASLWRLIHLTLKLFHIGLKLLQELMTITCGLCLSLGGQLWLIILSLHHYLYWQYLLWSNCFVVRNYWFILLILDFWIFIRWHDLLIREDIILQLF